MEFSKEKALEIERLSGAGYSMYEMHLFLGIPEEELQDEYDNPTTAFRFHMDRGPLLIKAENDLRLSESVNSGSITALQQLDKRITINEKRKFRNDLLGSL